ncbi:MAG TPA: hypothetical protein ENN44_01085 [Methanoculleus sp.]|nr:hypothetical protein [Methanoculleus sp.]
MEQTFNQIPAERRWDIATRGASMMPFAYDRAFRKIAPERRRDIDLAQKEIWREMGKNQAEIAKILGFRVDSAAEVAETFSAISTIIMGPELQGRVIPRAGDAATIVTDKCPMEANMHQFRTEARQTCEHCNAYGTEAVASLNPGYRLTSDRHMCMGDLSCRMTIEKIRQ